MLTAAALSSFTVLVLLAGSHRHEPTRPLIDVPASAHQDDSTKRRVQRRLVVALALVTSALLLGPEIAVALGVGLIVRPRLLRVLRQRQERAAIDAALPDAIEMLILVVRAGMTPHQAITLLTERAPAAIRPAFIEVDRRRARGSSLADALQALPELVGSGANVVADTLAMAERYGTPIGDALEQLSIDVRERRVRHAEAEARKLPIRMSFPLVVCTLPSFVLIAIVPAVLGALSSLDGTGLRLHHPHPLSAANGPPRRSVLPSTAPAVTPEGATMLDTTPLLMLTISAHQAGDALQHRLAEAITHIVDRRREALSGDRGQATTEYALVLLAAALVALLVVAWATAGGGAARISRLFNRVIDSVIDKV